MGCRIDTATNGKEAVQKVAGRKYDIVFMDCMMPEMSGYEATGKIREMEEGDGEHRTVIAMTASSMVGDRARCLASGMDDFIAKPVSINSLAETLKQYSRRSGA